MAPRHTKRAKKPHRRTHRISRGGGWSEGPNSVSPGYLIHNQYPGPGKDCTGNPASLRPGYIAYYTPEGLPGHGPGWSRGGRRRGKGKRAKGGALSVAANQLFGPVTNPNLAPVSGCLTPKPGYFPATQGVGGTVANPAALPVVMSMPGVPVNGQPLMPKVQLDASADPNNLKGAGQNGASQSGGRYGFFPGQGPLNGVSGIGTSPAPFGRIPCERGTFDALNANPDNVQGLTTAPPLPPYVTSNSPRMQGGAELMGAPTMVGSSGFSSANFPVVRVGDADSMRYYAPTAGYRNDFMTFRAPSAVPGLTIQTPYDARAFNQACIKTGGGKRRTHRKRKTHRSTHRRGGAAGHSIGEAGHPVAEDAGAFSKITLREVQNRSDFDNTKQGLPVRFGGNRRSKKSRKCQK
jgi:hypothetical protein